MCRHCIICKKPLNNGIIIYGQGICKECEERITSLQIGTDFYEFYKSCIKKNLVQVMTRGVSDKCQDYPL